MNQQNLFDFIFGEIIPRYESFDDAHKSDHAITVIKQALILGERHAAWIAEHPEAGPLWHTTPDRGILVAAAAYHDLGLVNGRERHHLDSGVIIRADERLREWFSEEEVELIAQAAEDHRASGKGAPRSIYGMIIAEADRVINGETIIIRTLQYGQKHYPELNRQGHIDRAVEHLQEKYGRGGYLKLWVPWSDNAARLNKLQDLIADLPALRQEVERIYELVI